MSRDLDTPESIREHKAFLIKNSLYDTYEWNLIDDIAANFVYNFNYLPNNLCFKPQTKVKTEKSFRSEFEIESIHKVYVGLIEFLYKEHDIASEHRKIMLDMWLCLKPHIHRFARFDLGGLPAAALVIYRAVFALLKNNITASPQFANSAKTFNTIVLNCVGLLSKYAELPQEDLDEIFDYIAFEITYYTQRAKDIRRGFSFRSGSKASPVRIVVVTALVSALLTFGISSAYFHNNPTTTQTLQSVNTAQHGSQTSRQTTLTPQAEPRTGYILSGVTGGGSQITVKASTSSACVVKLKDLTGNTILSFYVRAGSKSTVGVPAGYYYVYFASGKTWYGNSNLFGPDTYYSMDKDYLDFTNHTWEYELQEVANGNFSETPISEDQFN